MSVSLLSCLMHSITKGIFSLENSTISAIFTVLYYSHGEILQFVKVLCFSASESKSMTLSHLRFSGKTLAACPDPSAF